MKKDKTNILKFNGKVESWGCLSFNNPPKPQNGLMIGGPDGEVVFHLSTPIPNRWHRYWQKVFFGFTWVKVIHTPDRKDL